MGIQSSCIFQYSSFKQVELQSDSLETGYCFQFWFWFCLLFAVCSLLVFLYRLNQQGGGEEGEAKIVGGTGKRHSELLYK